MIFVDLSQVLISTVYLHAKDVQKIANGNDKGLIKHLFLNTLLSYKKKFGEKYGDMILASDSKHYWRRDIFSAYKGHRARQREASNLDWNLIYEIINELKNDIRENFLFKIIEVYGAEADDIIAVLSKYVESIPVASAGTLFDEPEPSLIISSDGDFVSLHSSNIIQWSPISGKYVKAKTTPYEHLIEKIVRGDAGDNIPNIFTSSEWSEKRILGEENIRANAVKASRLDSFFKEGINACRSEEEKNNYKRNQSLIDFSFIPKNLYNTIIDSFITYKVNGSKAKIMNYFIKNRLKNLIQEVGNF